MRDKVTKQYAFMLLYVHGGEMAYYGRADSIHKPQLLKREESRSGIEPRSFCLPAYRLTARPNRLTRLVCTWTYLYI